MSKNLPTKTRSLIIALYNQTLSGDIKWEKSDYSNSIECVIGSNYIQVTQFSNDYNEDVEYVLFVKDKSGNIKDRIDDATISSKPHYGGSSSASATFSALTSSDNSELKLERLYFEGRRRALGADDTLDEILGQLGVRP
jgi:hypothetical protein